MAIRDTQDVLITEQQWTSGTLRVTQDALLMSGRIRPRIFAFPRMRWSMSIHLSTRCSFISRRGLRLWSVYTRSFRPSKSSRSVYGDCGPSGTIRLLRTGLNRSMLERIDGVTTLTFPIVMQSDMAAWKAFEEYALSGATYALLPRLRPLGTESRWRSNRQYRLFDFSADRPGMVAEVRISPGFSLTMRLLLVKDM